MRAVWLMLWLCAGVPLAAGAASLKCTRLAAAVAQSGGDDRPSHEARVIHKGASYFYSAPSSLCRIGNFAVHKGDILTTGRSYRRWVSAMFLRRDGRVVIGWIESARVRPVVRPRR